MTRARARWMWWGIAGGAAAVLAGCSGEDDTPDPQPSDSRESTPVASTSPAPDEPPAVAHVAWTTDGYLQSAGVYNNVVITVAAGEPELMRGLDVATGEVLWETPTNRGSTTASQLVMPYPMETSTGEVLVVNITPPVYDEAENYSFHTLQLLNPVTGDVVQDYGRLWVSNFWQCSVEGGVCLWIARPGAVEDDVQVRINPETLELDAWDEAAIGEYAAIRWYGLDVYAVIDEEGDEYLVGLDDEGEQWRIPTSEAIREGAVATGEALVSSHLEDDGNVLVIAGDFDPDNAAAQISEVADFDAVAIDIEAGEVLWRKQGVTVCGGGVLCSGELSFMRDAEDYGGAYDLTTGVVALDGFDPRTGELTWSNAPIALEGISNGGSTAGFAATEGALYLTLDGETHTVKRDTGEVTPLGDDFAPCYQPIVEDRHAWSNPFSELVPTWVGFEYYLCNDAGPAGEEAEFTQDIVEAIETVTWLPEAQHDEELPMPRFRVINTPQGLLGFEF